MSSVCIVYDVFINAVSSVSAVYNVFVNAVSSVLISTYGKGIAWKKIFFSWYGYFMQLTLVKSYS